MHYITITELRKNLDYYLELSNQEDIYVTKHNKVIAVLTGSDKYRLSMIDDIAGSFGDVDENIDYDEILKKEIMKRCSN